MNMLRNWGFLCGVVLACCLPVNALAAAGHNVSILYTNDTHGHLQSFFADGNKPVGGVAKRAIFFVNKRAQKNMTWLTLDAGDTISGTPLSDIFQGFLDVEAMNRMHYDAMTLGTHDFDYGIDVLRQRMHEAQFPVLAANITIAKTGQTFTKPYVIIQRDGMKFAILGLTSQDTADQVDPTNFRNLSVTDPIQTARTLVPQLRKQADMVIALTHLGVNEDIHLASQVPGIDVIVGGMSQSELAVPMKVGETLIVQDAYNGKSVGMLKLSYGRDMTGKLRRVYFDNTLEPMDGRWTENNDYLKWLADYKVQMADKMGMLLGTTHGKFNASKVKSSETEMGNFVCDVLRQKLGADAAILPAAFFRQGLPDGAVTLGDLYAALPFDQYAVTLTVSGSELQQILNDAANQIGKPGFPQVSGVSFSIFNGHAPQSTIKVGGKDLDPFGTYTVATSDFIADGGLGYAAMGTIKTRAYSGRLIRDLVREKLGDGTTATSRLYARITFLAQEPEEVAQEPQVGQEPDLATASPASTPPADSGFVPDHESATSDHEQAPSDFSAGSDNAGSETSAPETTGSEPPVVDEPVTGEPPGGERPAPSDETTSSADTTSPPDSTDSGPPADSGDNASTDQGGVSLQDESVTDQDTSGTDNAPASDESNPLGTDTTSTTAPPTTPPVTAPTTTAGSMPPEDVLKGAKVIGHATANQGGLDYDFTLYRLKKGTYMFRLVAKNGTGQPVQVQYASGKRVEFAVYKDTDLQWDYNHNRFFTQSIISDTIQATPENDRNLRKFNGEWDGQTIERKPLPHGTYRFEATHYVMDSPVLLSFEATL